MSKYKCTKCRKEVTYKELFLDSSLGKIKDSNFTCSNCLTKPTKKKNKTKTNSKSEVKNKELKYAIIYCTAIAWILLLIPLPTIIIAIPLISCAQIMGIILLFKNSIKSGILTLCIVPTISAILIIISMLIFSTTLITTIAKIFT